MEFYCDSVVNNNPNINIISSIVGKPKSNHDCVDYSMDSLFHELFEGVDFDNSKCNTQTIFETVENNDFLGITNQTQSSFIDNSDVSELTNNFPCEQTFELADENSFYDFLKNYSDCDMDSQDSTNSFQELDENSSTPSLQISSPSAIFSSDSNQSKIDEGLVISDSDAEENSLAIQNSNVSFSDRVILDSKFDTITQTPLSSREELDISEDSEDIPCGQRNNDNDKQDVTKKNFLGLDEHSSQSSDFGSQLFSHFNISNAKINDELPISDSDDEVSAAIQNFDLSYFDRPSSKLFDRYSRQANIRSFHSTETQTNQQIQNSTSTQTNVQYFNSTHTQTNKQIENSTCTQTNVQYFNSTHTQTNKQIENSTCTQTNIQYFNSIHTQTNKQIQNSTFTQTNVHYGNSRQTNTNITIPSNSSKLSDIFLFKNKLKITKQNLKSVSKLKSLGFVLNNFYSKLKKNKPMLEEFDQDWERIGVCFKNVLDNPG